jgi:hypothetical protein
MTSGSLGSTALVVVVVHQEQVSNGKIRNDGSTDHDAGTNNTNESHVFFDAGDEGTSAEDKETESQSSSVFPDSLIVLSFSRG